MTSYWIKPTPEEIGAWRERSPADATISVELKCAANETTERAYLERGMGRISREQAEELKGQEAVERLTSMTVELTRQLEQNGQMEQARREMDQANQLRRGEAGDEREY